MKKIIGVYWLVYMCTMATVFGQDGLVLTNLFTATHTAFFVDNLNQVYLVKGSVLVKLDKNGNAMAEFSDEYHSSIDWVDVQDPYDVLVYYSNDNRVYRLDNMLNAKDSPFYLNRMDIDMPTVIAQSLDYNFWVFDPYYLTISAVDHKNEPVLETKDISHYTKENAQLNFLFDTGEYIIANDPSDGLLVFDEKGAYLKKFAYPKLSKYDISVSNGVLYVKVLRSLFAVDIATNKRQVIPLSENAQQVVVLGDILYHSNGESVKVFSGVLRK